MTLVIERSKFLQPSPRQLGSVLGALPKWKGSGSAKALGFTYLSILSPLARPPEMHGSPTRSDEPLACP